MQEVEPGHSFQRFPVALPNRQGCVGYASLTAQRLTAHAVQTHQTRREGLLGCGAVEGVAGRGGALPKSRSGHSNKKTHQHSTRIPEAGAGRLYGRSPVRHYASPPPALQQPYASPAPALRQPCASPATQCPSPAITSSRLENSARGVQTRPPSPSCPSPPTSAALSSVFGFFLRVFFQGFRRIHYFFGCAFIVLLEARGNSLA